MKIDEIITLQTIQAAKAAQEEEASQFYEQPFVDYNSVPRQRQSTSPIQTQQEAWLPPAITAEYLQKAPELADIKPKSSMPILKNNGLVKNLNENQSDLKILTNHSVPQNADGTFLASACGNCALAYGKPELMCALHQQKVSDLSTCQAFLTPYALVKKEY